MIFILNVFCISLAAALWEIYMERDKGWGAGLDRNTWYGKIIGEKSTIMKCISRMVGVPYFFGYAIFMYFFLVPLILILEYFVLHSNPLLLLSSYVAILVVEDFTWFLLNPYFPSLQELLKGPYGEIWWHKRWVRIFGDQYLPQSYFLGLFFSALLFVLAS